MFSGQSFDRAAFDPSAWLFASEQVAVPDVVGESEEDARAALSDAGLTVIVQRAYSESVPAGDVIRQTPSAGATVDVGSTVYIRVSRGARPAGGGNGFIEGSGFIDVIQ